MFNLLNAVNFFGITLDLEADTVLMGILISQILLAFINIFAVAIVLTRISVSKAVQKNAAFVPRKTVVETKDGTDVLLTATAPQDVAADELVWFIDGKKAETGGLTYLFHATSGAHEITVAAGETTVTEISVFVTSDHEEAPAEAPKEEIPAEPVVEPILEETSEEAAMSEVAPAEAPTEEPEDLDDETVEIVVEDEQGRVTRSRYDLSFTAKLTRASDEVKGWYAAIKNELLSYGKTKGRMSWKKETFKSGRDKTLARLSIRGKTLCVHLPLDAAEFAESKYKVEEVPGDTPCVLYRIRNDRRAKYCKDLIALVAERFELARVERTPEEYYLPEKSLSQLMEEGLVKLRTVEVPASAAAFLPVSPAEQPIETPAAAPIEQPIETPAAAPIEQPTEEPVVSAVVPTEEPIETPEAAPIEEPVEQPAEEPVEAPAEEPIEQPVEEPIETPEVAPIEQPVEEPIEELVEDSIETSEDVSDELSEEDVPTEEPTVRSPDPHHGKGNRSGKHSRRRRRR